MDVDVRDLELLDALGRHETLTAAARHLYVSQPALSQRLLRLEERLATPAVRSARPPPRRQPAGHRMLRAPRRSPWASCAPRRATCASSSAAVGNRCASRRSAQPPTSGCRGAPRAYVEREPACGGAHRDSARRRDHLGAPRRTDRRRAHQQARSRRWIACACNVSSTTSSVRSSPRPPVGRPGACRGCGLRRRPPDVVRELRPEPCASVPLPVPIGAQPRRLTTLPLTVDLLIEMVASGGDVVTILPSWIVVAVHGDPRHRERASRRDTASAHLVLRNPPRCPAGEHRSVRLGS